MLTNVNECMLMSVNNVDKYIVLVTPSELKNSSKFFSISFSKRRGGESLFLPNQAELFWLKIANLAISGSQK